MKGVRFTTGLTELRPEARTYEHLDTCHLCGDRAYGDMRLYRECDGKDVPNSGTDALLVTCAQKTCERILEKHPRLYVEEEPGAPGYFPRLCGDCPWRRGVVCAHPHLKANRGRGLRVTIERPSGILCGSGGCLSFPRTATDCEGRRGGPAALGGGGPR